MGVALEGPQNHKILVWVVFEHNTLQISKVQVEHKRLPFRILLVRNLKKKFSHLMRKNREEQLKKLAEAGFIEFEGQKGPSNEAENTDEKISGALKKMQRHHSLLREKPLKYSLDQTIPCDDAGTQNCSSRKEAIILKSKFGSSSLMASKSRLGNGAGVELQNPKGKQYHASYCLQFQCTCNTEYEALIPGLKMALKKGVKHLQVVHDSELVIKQVCNIYTCKDPKLNMYNT